MGELEGKVALITGSSRGIGAACAAVMAREGADVVVNYRQDRAAAEAVANGVRSHGRRALVVQADVADRTQIQILADRAQEAFGRVDVLVNNVGHHATWTYGIEEVTLEQWYEALDVNLSSQLWCIRAVLPGMKARGWGRVINMSSVTSQRGSRSGDVCYTASKMAVNGLTLAVFRSLAPHGITVNTLSPGTIDTPLTRAVLSTPEKIQEYINIIPVGRMGTSEEVAEAACFLASERASYITGQLIAVNGGTWV